MDLLLSLKFETAVLMIASRSCRDLFSSGGTGTCPEDLMNDDNAYKHMDLVWTSKANIIQVWMPARQKSDRVVSAITT